MNTINKQALLEWLDGRINLSKKTDQKWAFSQVKRAVTLNHFNNNSKLPGPLEVIRELAECELDYEGSKRMLKQIAAICTLHIDGEP